MRIWVVIAAALLLAQLGAQNPPPPPPAQPEVAPGGVFQIPTRGAEVAPPPKKEEEGPKKAVLEYTGKPLQLPFACGEDEIQSYGLTCTDEDPCPIYAEMSGFQVIGQRIVIIGNFHHDRGTMASLLLTTEDGGKKWDEPFERIKSASLDHIQYLDLATGWISGQVFDSLPRDPFFLLTTDGGKFWRKRPVFDDQRISSIESFWFESKTRGVMLVDRVQGAQNNARYERYETMTGGDTWAVRELSANPINLRIPPSSGNADWRLRADAPLQANLLERKVGERWQTVAAFLIKAGECKPSLAPLEPPPAIEEPPPPPGRGPTTTRPKGPSSPPSLKRP